jgi:hypothetical protein
MQVLQSIKGCQAELALLRDRSASAWEALLRHYGETKQSCPTDTEFWADMQVRWLVMAGYVTAAAVPADTGDPCDAADTGVLAAAQTSGVQRFFQHGETKQSCLTDTKFWADMQVRWLGMAGYGWLCSAAEPAETSEPGDTGVSADTGALAAAQTFAQSAGYCHTHSCSCPCCRCCCCIWCCCAAVCGALQQCPEGRYA